MLFARPIPSNCQRVHRIFAAVVFGLLLLLVPEGGRAQMRFDGDMIPNLAAGETEKVGRSKYDLLALLVISQVLGQAKCQLAEGDPAQRFAAELPATIVTIQRRYQDVMMTMMFANAHPAVLATVRWVDVHDCDSPETQRLMSNMITVLVERTKANEWRN